LLIALQIKSKIFNREWWTTRVTLIVRDEENFAEKRRISYSPLHVALTGFFGFISTFSLGFVIANTFFVPPKFTGQDAIIARQVLELNYTVDSLAKVLANKNNYIENVRKIFGEDVKYLKDESKAVSTKSDKKVKTDSVNIDRLDQSDMKLREEMERGSADFARNTGANKLEDLKDIYLFQPLKGIVTEKYNPKNNHYGVDIVAEKDAPIKAISEGTVIMASWTDDTGYVITVQHRAELISVYKHCSVLLKKSGDFVRAGEIIAIIGNTGELTTGPHVHFEVWYQGNPVNPEKVIAF
jgi:murein DD-endopeptidase MepM/ murein hydrolase activator NlpD